MIRHYLHTIQVLLLLILFSRCAQIAPLSGGERDTVPPKLEEAVPAANTLNFNSNQIILRFNEYVKLKDLKNQLVVSPGLKTDPEISAEGKKIIIALKKEELAPNTTYRFYFGNAIADMTEGNTTPNFEYVFSTGNFIDSLKLKGNVTDAFTEQPLSDVVIGLYRADSGDSAVYKKSPDFITKSVEGGVYHFSHLPKNAFRLISFTDKNKNYRYDPESEKIGFYDNNVTPGLDSVGNMKVFMEESSRLYIKKTISPYYGLFNVVYNRKSIFKSRPLYIQPQSRIIQLQPAKENDTLTFIYDGVKDSIGMIITDQLSKKSDTIRVTVPKLNNQRKKSLSIKTNVINGTLSYNRSLILSFLNVPDTVKSDKRKIHLYRKDSLWNEIPLKLVYDWPIEAIVTANITEGKEYKLKIDTAAFYDLNERYNDSLAINFKPQSITELGKATIKLLLNKKQAYIVQFVNEKSQIEKQEFISLSLSSSNAVSIDFTGVSPGVYTVKLIFDDNENKKWDSGDFIHHKQAEKVFISSKQVKVLPDWEVEEEILIR